MTERRQPTPEELRALLAACSGPGRTSWSERVFALKEALDLRHTWHGAHEALLREEIHAYLRKAGLPV